MDEIRSMKNVVNLLFDVRLTGSYIYSNEELDKMIEVADRLYHEMKEQHGL